MKGIGEKIKRGVGELAVSPWRRSLSCGEISAVAERDLRRDPFDVACVFGINSCNVGRIMKP